MIHEAVLRTIDSVIHPAPGSGVRIMVVTSTRVTVAGSTMSRTTLRADLSKSVTTEAGQEMTPRQRGRPRDIGTRGKVKLTGSRRYLTNKLRFFRASALLVFRTRYIDLGHQRKKIVVV